MRDYFEALGLLKRELLKQERAQNDVAKWLKVAPSSISLLFNGLRPMRLEQFMIVCEKLHLQPDQILGYKGGHKESFAGIQAKNQEAFGAIVGVLRTLDDKNVDLIKILPNLQSYLDVLDTEPIETVKKKLQSPYVEESETPHSSLILPYNGQLYPAYNMVVDKELKVLDASVREHYPYIVPPEDLIGVNLNDILINKEQWQSAFNGLKYKNLDNYLVLSSFFVNGLHRKVLCRISRAETRNTYVGRVENLIQNGQQTKSITKLDPDLNFIEEKATPSFKKLLPSSVVGFNVADFLPKSQLRDYREMITYHTKMYTPPRPFFRGWKIHFNSQVRKIKLGTYPQKDCITNYMTAYRDYSKMALVG